MNGSADNSGRSYRVMLYHKQATSARTRFVKFDSGSVLGFDPLARLAQVDDAKAGNTRVHPASVLRETEQRLGLDANTLVAEPEFQHAIDVPGGVVQVLLAAISTMDPPFEAVEKAGGRFIDLTQARGLPPVEMEMLRHAYELVLG